MKRNRSLKKTRKGRNKKRRKKIRKMRIQT